MSVNIRKRKIRKKRQLTMGRYKPSVHMKKRSYLTKDCKWRYKPICQLIKTEKECKIERRRDRRFEKKRKKILVIMERIRLLRLSSLYKK